MVVSMTPEKRTLIVAAHDVVLQKSSLGSAFQCLIKEAIAAKVIEEEQRFGLHDLNRSGVTDTPGMRADKQAASGHRTEAMMDVYDLSVPIVDPLAQ